MDAALMASDALEKDLQKRIAEVYGDALKRAVRNNRLFLTNVKKLDARAAELEKGGWTSEKIEKWRKEEVLRLLRQQRLVQNIADEMNRAGIEIAPEIKSRMAEVYKVNSDMTYQRINGKINADFALIPKKQIPIILDDTQPVFSKIAYRHLGQNKTIRAALQREMAQAAILGESQEKIIKRIQKVTGQAEYQARRVAQTERNRVQSQARADALHEAAQAGVIVTKKWSARMRNTRDSHAALNGVEIPENEKFRTIWGNELRYPGDPEAPAKEVINCFVKETRIASNTSVEAATEREYIGELVTIETRGGIKFSCTPNHPVLTDKGWIAAGALYEGCNILTSGFAENFCSWIYPNKNNVVPCIYDIYQLFSRISFVNRIARGLVNFHGDIPDTDVKVVFSPCFLQNRGKPLFFKKIKHFFFKFSDFEKATFSCKRMIYKFTSLGWRSASRFIRFLRNFCFFFIGGMLETKKLRFAKAANRTAVFKKKTINSSSIQSFSVCDGIDRFPSDVTVDDIISVKRRENVACHVYNLQTENQIYGVNESISQNVEKHNCKFAIVHNCHCVLIPGVLLPGENADARLKKEAESGIVEKAEESAAVQSSGRGTEYLKSVLSEEDFEKYQQMLSSADESVQTLFASKGKDVYFADAKYTGHSHYSAGDGIYTDVITDMAKKPRTLFHEMGHSMDNMLHIEKTFSGTGKNADISLGYSYTYKKNKLGNALARDAENALQNYKKELEKAYEKVKKETDEWFSSEKTKEFFSLFGMGEEEQKLEYKMMLTENIRKAKAFVPETRHGLEDMFCDYIKGSVDSESRIDISDMFEAQMQYVAYPFNGGHGRDYWKKGEALAPMEAFAEMTSAQIANHGSWEQIQKYFPESVKVYREMLGGLAK